MKLNNQYQASGINLFSIDSNEQQQHQEKREIEHDFTGTAYTVIKQLNQSEYKFTKKSIVSYLKGKPINVQQLRSDILPPKNLKAKMYFYEVQLIQQLIEVMMKKQFLRYININLSKSRQTRRIQANRQAQQLKGKMPKVIILWRKGRRTSQRKSQPNTRQLLLTGTCYDLGNGKSRLSNFVHYKSQMPQNIMQKELRQKQAKRLEEQKIKRQIEQIKAEKKQKRLQAKLQKQKQQREIEQQKKEQERMKKFWQGQRERMIRQFGLPQDRRLQEEEVTTTGILGLIKSFQAKQAKKLPLKYDIDMLKSKISNQNKRSQKIETIQARESEKKQKNIFSESQQISQQKKQKQFDSLFKPPSSQKTFLKKQQNKLSQQALFTFGKNPKRSSAVKSSQNSSYSDILSILRPKNLILQQQKQQQLTINFVNFYEQKQIAPNQQEQKLSEQFSQTRTLTLNFDNILPQIQRKNNQLPQTTEEQQQNDTCTMVYSNLKGQFKAIPNNTKSKSKVLEHFKNDDENESQVDSSCTKTLITRKKSNLSSSSDDSISKKKKISINKQEILRDKYSLKINKKYQQNLIQQENDSSSTCSTMTMKFPEDRLTKKIHREQQKCVQFKHTQIKQNNSVHKFKNTQKTNDTDNLKQKKIRDSFVLEMIQLGLEQNL